MSPLDHDQLSVGGCQWSAPRPGDDTMRDAHSFTFFARMIRTGPRRPDG